MTSPRGRKLSDAYVELHADDSRLRPEVRVKGQRVAKEFGGALNRQLKALNIDQIDVKASPAKAVAALDAVGRRLKMLRKDAETVETRVKATRALAAVDHLRKQIDMADDKPVEPVAEVSPAARRIAALADQIRALGLDPVDIDADPSSAARAVERLQKQVAALSADAGNVEVRIRSDQVLGDLGKLRKQIGDVGDDSGGGFVRSFTTRASSLLSTGMLSSPVAAAAVAAGAAAAPLLGAAMAGAVIGNITGMGIIGGLTVVAKDERVKAAGVRLGEVLLSRLQRASAAFIRPALAGMQQIEQAANEIDIEGIFRRTSAMVGPLVSGVSSLLIDFGNAVERIVAKSGPVIESIGAGVARIGRALSEGLANLADNSEDSAAALNTVFRLVDSGISTVFGLVNMLSEVYGWMRKIGADTGFQVLLKLTSRSMDGVTFSAERTKNSTSAMGEEFKAAEDKAKKLKEQQEFLKPAQDAVRMSQEALTRTLTQLGGQESFAGRQAAALRTAMDNLYGATQRNVDANEEYEASWDSLSASVKSNGRSLDIHSEKGRSNRDVLQALLGKNNELYVANVAAGQSVDSARRKHEARTEAIRKEAIRLKFNKEETQRLINTYGKIPGDKTTNLVLDGVKAVVASLNRLYIYQRALAEGKSVEAIETIIRKGNDSGPAKGGGYAFGGQIPGHSPHDRADNIHGIIDGRDPVRLTAKEWVHPVDAVRYYGPKFMRAIQRRELPREIGQIATYAAGGQVLARVDTSHRWPFTADMSDTKIPTMAQVAAKVVGQFGKWPSSPSAQRGDSGVWRKIRTLIQGSGIRQGEFGNGYRPGDPKWHGSGRALDWMGFNMDRLARFFLRRQGQILEMIHRTNTRDYAYTRGRNMGSFNRTLMENHRNHLHIAMRRGGQVPVAKVAMADTGRAILERGWNLIGNNTGAREHLSAAQVDMSETNALLRQLIAVAAGWGDDVAAALTTAGRRTTQVARSRGVPMIAGAM